MSPPRWLPLVEILYTQVLICRTVRAHWFARPAMTSAVSGAPLRCSCPTVPHRLMLWVHPRTLRVPFRVQRSRFAGSLLALATDAPLVELRSPSRYQSTASTSAKLAPRRRRRSTTCFVPSATFLTPSTVSSAMNLASLFHPATTSGIRSSGCCPLDWPYELVARRCPLDVHAHFLPLLFKHRLQKSTPAFRAWIQPRIRCRHMGV